MKRILVVDDVQLICTLCQNTLIEGGYQVVTQLSGARCLSYLKGKASEPVDLVILDVEMPYMSGFQTLERIREISDFAELPVMFLTSTCTKETVAKAIALGAVDYLKKPFNADELLKRVKKILGPPVAAKPQSDEESEESAEGSEAGEAPETAESAENNENANAEEKASEGEQA